MVTAGHALKQGRDVYVMAIGSDDVRAAGSNHLIDDGAPSFSNVAEIVRHIGEVS